MQEVYWGSAFKNHTRKEVTNSKLVDVEVELGYRFKIGFGK